MIAAADHPLRGRTGLRLTDLVDFPWVLPSPQSYMVERLRVIFRAAGLPAPEPAIETDIVLLKLQLMLSGPYLSFHAASHLAELDTGSICSLDVPEANWRRVAGIILRRGITPAAPVQLLIEEIERSSAALSATPLAKAASPSYDDASHAGG